jgi:hypothetical protein
MIKLKNNYFKIILISSIILFIFIFIISIIYFYYNNKNNNIKFLSKEETIEFIRNDNDNYIKNLSIYDLRARKVNTNDEYKEKVINDCLDFTKEQKEKLNICSLNAEKYFNNNEKWIFASINNNYEEGFPHTRKNIIFLSPNVINYDEIELTKTLIHESIHIYQRYNKKEIKKYLKENQYSISRYKPVVSLIRANPDLDNYIYKDRNGIEMVAYYKNEYPNGINDIKLKNYAYEHPYEKMAYDIADDYYKSVISKYKNIS